MIVMMKSEIRCTFIRFSIDTVEDISCYESRRLEGGKER